MNDWLAKEVSVSPAAASEWPAAIELLVSRLDEPLRSEQLTRFMELDAVGTTGRAGLLVARRGSRLAGACLAVVQPGRTATVWPPELVAGDLEITGTKLLSGTQDSLSRRGVRVAQALLDTDAGISAARLASAGFMHAADLLFLVCGPDQFPDVHPGHQLQFEAYGPENHVQLIDLVERSYVGTLDCPRLNGIRDTADVLDGYRQTGVFDPSRWLLALEGQQHVGCLLLTEHAPESQWEIVYVALVPEVRGRGLGRLLIRHAQWLAATANCPRLVLAVDAANEPALRAYAECGFVAWDRRSVFLSVLDSPKAIP